jgi:hypothetical protein
MPEPIRLTIKHADTVYFSTLDRPGFPKIEDHRQVPVEHRARLLEILRQKLSSATGVEVKGNEPETASGFAAAFKEIGQILYAQFLPKQIRESLPDMAEPPAVIVIDTNDHELPWELLYYQDQLLSLSHAVARAHPHMMRPREPKPICQLKVLLICADPGNDLPDAEIEFMNLLEALGELGIRCFPHAREGASVFNIEKELSDPSYDIVHFTGHTVFDYDNPSKCGLRLHDGILCVDDVEQLLVGRPFVFINGCSSGRERQEHNHFLSQSRLAGLASACLRAGARGFVGTQWPIEAGPSRVFAEVLYKECFAAPNPLPVSEALYRARLAAKDSDSRGFTWPSFVYYGDPWLKLVKQGDDATKAGAQQIQDDAPQHTRGSQDGKGSVSDVPGLTSSSQDTGSTSTGQETGTTSSGQETGLEPSGPAIPSTSTGREVSSPKEPAQQGPRRVRPLGSLWSGCARFAKRYGRALTIGGITLVVLLVSFLLWMWLKPSPVPKLVHVESVTRGELLTVTAFGQNLASGTEVFLSLAKERVKAKDVRVFPEAKKIEADFELRKLSPGKWDVQVGAPDGALSEEKVVVYVPTPSPTVSPTRQTPSPSTSTRALTPSATFTPSPIRVSPTHVPTWTATPTPMPSATSTQTPSLTSTPKPPPSRPLARPRLEQPADHTQALGFSIELTWQDPRGELGNNEFYDVRLAPAGQEPKSIGWSDKESYKIGNSDLSTGYYVWNIWRIRLVGTSPNGSKQVEFLGDVSDTWEFSWKTEPRGTSETIDKDGDEHYWPDDCDDNDSSVHPGAREIWYNDKDENCIPEPWD